MCADMTKQVEEVEKWLKTKPKLPQNIDKSFLKRFVFSMNGDVEGAQILIKHHFKLRNKYDHVFLKRDPMDDSSLKMLRAAKYCEPSLCILPNEMVSNIKKNVPLKISDLCRDYLTLPGKTPDNYKLMLYRLEDHDPEKFVFIEAIKVFFMMADCRFAVDDDEDCSGEVPIFDMTGFTLKHVARTTLSALRIYMKFIQEAHPVRIQQIHILNVPSYLDKVLSVIKPFIKGELFKLLHFHLPNSETAYEFFPRDMLPEEYGGKGGKLSDLRQYWLTKLKEKREFIMDESKWKMDKSRKSSTPPELIHSLENLEID